MMLASMIKVGGEVDALCSKCELTLAHTVIAMVGDKPAKVKCNTCKGEHKYRPLAGAVTATGSVAKKKASRPPREKKVLVSFDEMLAAHKRPPVPYSLKRRFVVDDVLDHPTFGRGFVNAVRIDKIDVTFSAEPRVLVHGRT
jgi:hypothetical protein